MRERSSRGGGFYPTSSQMSSFIWYSAPNNNFMHLSLAFWIYPPFSRASILYPSPQSHQPQ
ncbi:hypothetical protein VPHD30_0192 [Vibrio phage D30]